MEVIREKGCLPILNWAKGIDDAALRQAMNVAKHPCVVNHVALAPDAHCGFGVPIGCIIAVDNAVIPNAVGVDIGCSMSACRTNIRAAEISRDLLCRIMGTTQGSKTGLYAAIPVGPNHHTQRQQHPIFDEVERWQNTRICREEYDSAQFQLGTMGGGNHFIELQTDEEGVLWYMIHSGSRNLGNKVGTYYNKIAMDLCTCFRHETVVKNQLSFLPRGTEEYELYVREMQLCMDFAKANHDKMQELLQAELCKHIPGIEFEPPLYTRHNYAAQEHHFGRDLWIHRKGAVLAQEGMRAIIPGSQGTASYIVEGLSNPRSFCSASHGSGRVLSRSQAQQTLSLETEQERMKDIVHNMHSQSQLDEAPSAYKDIEEVMQQEADLVRPLVRLRPLAVIKG